VKNRKGVIRIAPSFFEGMGGCEFKMGKKTIKKYRDLEFEHDMRIVKQKDSYWLLVPILQETNNPKPSTPYSYCGIDPGVRTFMTIFETNDCIEYQHNEDALKKLNAKHKVLLNRKKNNIFEKRALKRKLIKIR
jgi:transposase